MGIRNTSLHKPSAYWLFSVMFVSGIVMMNPRNRPKLIFACMIEPVWPESESGDTSLTYNGMEVRSNPQAIPMRILAVVNASQWLI